MIRVTLSTIHATAQTGPSFGVKGGLNYSTFNNTDNLEYKAGVLAGLYASIKIPDSPASIQPEILYAQYGANIEDSDGKFTVNYVQIPVIAKFGFGDPAQTTRPSVFFGPYVGFNVGAEVESPDFSINADDYFENTDAGVVVGAGIDIRQISINFRYTAGLTNIVAPEDFEDEQKNGAFALTIGIGF
ncbi:MAG: PorT family protein [Balneolaceae bacterium]|nr:PorT family protein [Balneolaceae bacterium]